MVCKHNDGWIINGSEEVVNVGQDSDFEVDAVCNHLGCHNQVKLRVSCSDIMKAGD